MRRPIVGLVVPSIFEGGGVPAVAKFAKDAIEASGEFDLKVISLTTSFRDESSVRMRSPPTWSSGVRSRTGEWHGLSYDHVGANLSELEFMRYMPRRLLGRMLSGVDLIQVIAGSPAWAVPVMGCGKPVVIQVATRTAVERRRRQRVEQGPIAWWRWAMTRITDRLDDRGLRASRAVLVMNPWMLRYACTVGAPSGAWVRYAPPGVDCSFFSPAPDRPSLMKNDAYILAVGRFDDPRKNADLLLEAYAKLNRISKTAPRLQLAGAGDPGARFWRRARELGVEQRIAFHLRPSAGELAAYYRAATCFVLSSDEEGFGIVVIEAMASGIPVVATRCGGPDGIITDGVDGLLVACGDAAGLAERVRDVTEDMGRNLQIGMLARRTVTESYAREAASEKYLDTYRRLLRCAARSGTTGACAD
jgi:glycosyltransferase involved in cell wall biosynthesis